MATQPENNELLNDWRPASGREIVGLARMLKRRQRDRRALLVGGAAGGVLAMLGGWWTLQRAEQSSRQRGLTCTEVAAFLEELEQGRLAPDVVVMVRRHVLACEHCRPIVEQRGLMEHLGGGGALGRLRFLS